MWSVIVAAIGVSQAVKCYVCGDCDSATGEQDCGSAVKQCIKSVAGGVGKYTLNRRRADFERFVIFEDIL